jgi:hypothetical protein
MSEVLEAPSSVQPEPGISARSCKFWFVWNKDGGAPRHTHESYALAAREACRLAKKSPGAKFIVLMAQRKFWVEAAAAQTDPA